MRLNVFALTALLPVAGLMSGCAMGTQGTSAATVAPALKSVSGKAFGGQQAVANGQIVVYQYGNTGYGSTGTVIANTTTDAAGNFNVNYTCTNPNAPLYILSIGGQPGINLANNKAILLGSGIGTCAASETGYVTINEISTTVLAFALSHFFSSGSTDSYTTDHFGSPASLTPAISRVNSGLIPTIIDPRSGLPLQSTSTFTNEAAKIVTIADVLGACVNSAGPGSPACTTLFRDTTPAGGTAPTNTLEAAVIMALQPTTNVTDLYSLVPPSGSSAFAGSLATQPNDWTLAVSYTAPTMGLGVDPFTVTTLDIDTAGRVWFPSNTAGAAGAAYFDSATSSFSQVFTAPGLLRPEQVVVDINNEVWVNDTQSAVVAGYPVTSPTAPVTLTLPGTISTALTVLDDNSLRLGVVNTASALPSFAAITNGTTYAQIPNTTPQGSQGYIGASLAGDTVGGTAGSATDTYTPNIFDLYIAGDGSQRAVLFQAFADSGQVAFTGADYVSTRGGFNAAADGLCIFTVQNCFPFADQSANRHPTGLVVDGGGNLWLSDAYTPDVQEIANNNGSYLNGSNVVSNKVYIHGTNNGATLSTPGGIAVDSIGNVFVSNIGCSGVNCVPTPFVLTELIGAGVPTINPIAAQVVLNSSPGVEPAVKKSVAAK